MSISPLSLRHVSKSFADKKAVRDVSFDIHPGEIVGFLGPNGAGKTTTLRMALGLIEPDPEPDPDKGIVKMFGQPPGPQSFSRIGFLPEERGLYKKQTARAAIAYMAQLHGMNRKDAYVRADSLLDKYGLSEARTMKNKDLSKGMAQKVQVLAAIAHDPEFYILDEPFSGLDPVNQQVLEAMIREISGRDHTIIFSTHVMEHAQRLCDRIILMSGGSKLFDGSTEAALSKAPNRLIIQSEDGRLNTVITPFISGLEKQKNGSLLLTLRPGADAQAILECCVHDKIKLIRFQPLTPTLHDAFVALVGRDEAAKFVMSETIGDAA